MDGLVSAALQPVRSCLLQRSGGGDGGGGEFSSVSTAMKRAILEVVASGAATSRQVVEKYASWDGGEVQSNSGVDSQGAPTGQKIVTQNSKQQTFSLSYFI